MRGNTEETSEETKRAFGVIQARAEMRTLKMIASGLHLADFDGFSERVIDLPRAAQEELCGRID